jgi:tetratricopeptide (TPR) repeat protein
MLASKLPEASGIIEKVGRYGIGALEEFKEKDPALYNQLLYLMGRHLYAQGSFREAIDVFQEVSPKSKEYTYAKFFEGISFIRMRQARPATASFRSILEAIDAGDVEGVDEERMRNLAWISLARVYYTAANQAQSGEIDGTLLGQSVESWTKVEQSSEYWLDSLFESSWAFFLADEYSRALGNVHTLYSPYFDDAFYPEALVLKAVTFFVNCQVDNAEATVAQFHDRYDPVKQELDSVLKKHQDNAAFFEFLKKVRHDEAELSSRVRPIVKSALSDRTVLQHLEYVAILDKEEARLAKSGEKFQGSPVGEKVLEDVALARSFAVDQAGDLARGRYNRLIRELQDLGNQVDTVELEIATFRRGQIDQELQQQMSLAKQSKGGDVNVDEEHQLWPFDGEWWRDELGFYRQQVTNLCTR